VIVKINTLMLLNQYLSDFSSTTLSFAKSGEGCPTVLVKWYFEIEQNTLTVVICKSHMINLLVYYSAQQGKELSV
jgi:hypothetical protein